MLKKILIAAAAAAIPLVAGFAQVRPDREMEELDRRREAGLERIEREMDRQIEKMCAEQEQAFRAIEERHEMKAEQMEALHHKRAEALERAFEKEMEKLEKRRERAEKKFHQNLECMEQEMERAFHEMEREADRARSDVDRKIDQAIRQIDERFHKEREVFLHAYRKKMEQHEAVGAPRGKSRRPPPENTRRSGRAGKMQPAPRSERARGVGSDEASREIMKKIERLQREVRELQNVRDALLRRLDEAGGGETKEDPRRRRRNGSDRVDVKNTFKQPSNQA